MIADSPGTWGTVFHWIDADNHHAVLWEQFAEGLGRIRLVQRRDAVNTTLAETPLGLATGQWYRLEIVSCENTVRVFVGPTEVLRSDEAGLFAGRVGLAVQNARSVYFDDVSAVSAGPEALAPDWRPKRPFGPCEQQWSDFSKKSFYSDQFGLSS